MPSKERNLGTGNKVTTPINISYQQKVLYVIVFPSSIWFVMGQGVSLSKLLNTQRAGKKLHGDGRALTRGGKQQAPDFVNTFLMEYNHAQSLLLLSMAAFALQWQT